MECNLTSLHAFKNYAGITNKQLWSIYLAQFGEKPRYIVNEVVIEKFHFDFQGRIEVVG